MKRDFVFQDKPKNMKRGRNDKEECKGNKRITSPINLAHPHSIQFGSGYQSRDIFLKFTSHDNIDRLVNMIKKEEDYTALVLVDYSGIVIKTGENFIILYKMDEVDNFRSVITQKRMVIMRYNFVSINQNSCCMEDIFHDGTLRYIKNVDYRRGIHEKYGRNEIRSNLYPYMRKYHMRVNHFNTNAYLIELDWKNVLLLEFFFLYTREEYNEFVKLNIEKIFLLMSFFIEQEIPNDIFHSIFRHKDVIKLFYLPNLDR